MYKSAHFDVAFTDKKHPPHTQNERIKIKDKVNNSALKDLIIYYYLLSTDKTEGKWEDIKFFH